jgi:hypothetical protein
MKGSKVDWRTVQVFLSPTGIFEVQLTAGSEEARCNCPSFIIRSSCKHTRYVKARMEENEGNYAILVPDSVPEELAAEASESAEKFREFVLKYARVEVL